MRVFNSLYENVEQLQTWIEKNNISQEKQCLVLIHSSVLNSDECVDLAKAIKKILPHALVNGCSTTGVIYENNIHHEGTLINIRTFEYGKVFSSICPSTNLTPAEIVEQISEEAKKYNSKFANIFFSFFQEGAFEIAKLLNTSLPDAVFVGGYCGAFRSDTIIDSFVFDENKAYYDSRLVNYISSDFVLAYSDIITGHSAVSDVFTITKAHDTVVEEIENIPALEWFDKKLGLHTFSENSSIKNAANTDILLRFPFILEGYNSSSRFVKYDEKTNRLEFYNTKLEAGQKFRVGYLSPLKSSEEMQELCHNLQMIPAEMIFCYSCIFRKEYSNGIAKWEFSAFKGNGVCGAFLLGEIGTKLRQVQHLNGSSCFFTLAEKVEHIKLNLQVFDTVDTLFEANEALLDSISTVDAKLKSDVFSSLVAHEKKVKKRFLYVNEDNIQSIPTFLKRQAENKQEQICLVSIEAFEDHLMALGEEEFEQVTQENKEKIISFLKKRYTIYHFNFYQYDFAHFFFTVEEKISDTVFESIVKTLSAECSQGKFLNREYECINEFTYTLNGINIQQLLALSKAKDVPFELKKYSHIEKDQSETSVLYEEFQMVAALKTIIEQNDIIPYFQGIYDNKRNCFHMYEALMRLQHPDGKMIFPNDFMDIAKKYDLYLTLSLAMVKKVFELFKDREERITLNISAYDILSEDFRNTVFAYLDEMPNPQNFVFELLETEAFTDLESLRSFIYQLKQYGCKIAVDDFGAGYSNFIEFGNLDVDYLKLNGSLTKLLGTDFNYNHILNSIAFMGEKMHVKLIAEYVETAATQKLLIESGVHFSQGYFFSKPMPFSELKVVSEENRAKNDDIIEEVDEKHVAFNQNRAKQDNLLLYIGGFLVALLTVLAVVFHVNYTKNEFKKINDAFLVEIATGISDKIALFAEESKISLEIMAIAMAEVADNPVLRNGINQELLVLTRATKFASTYICLDGENAVDPYGNLLEIPIEQVQNKTKPNEVVMLPIMEDANGNKLLIFATDLIERNEKIGEIYGAYMVEDISKLLALKSFGGEAFYHISQVDGTPIYLSGKKENAFTSGDMYSFIGSLDIFNGHDSASIKKDMYAGNTVLLNYRLKGEERSAVMVRIPNTDWCVVSIVLDEINTQMIESNNKSIVVFIAFLSMIYLAYFIIVTFIFRKHRKVILETLEASQSLSNSLQMSIEKDSLTGTYSRATAIEKISNIIAAQNAKGTIHALAILDIDNFKLINDTFGHHSGDIYLQSFVSAVKLGIKPGNILGRLGGDEFLLLLNDVDNEENVKSTFDNIFNNIRKINLGGIDLTNVSVSAGIVLITENEKTYEELMIEADSTLYKAKREGKNKYLFSE